MPPVSYARHQFSPEIIQRAVWLYLRFTLSYRDVEELLAERGLEVSYETIRRWVLKFGPAFAHNLRRLRPRPTGTWHLDEMVIAIQGRRLYLWRAMDSEGEILDILVQSRREKAAALKLMRKLLKRFCRKHFGAGTRRACVPNFDPVLTRFRWINLSA
jgi:transposase-like protein